MKISDDRSIVALDPTTRGIAFIFFENGQVLDWGERLRSGRAESEIQIVDRLLDGCAAEVLVLEDPDAVDCRRRPRIRNLLRAILAHMRRRRVTLLAIGRGDVRDAWLARGATTKESVAARIASRFPDLSGIVPQKRKIGANEDPRVNIFDAASLAIHACDLPGSASDELAL